MQVLSGIRAKSRFQLAAVLRRHRGAVTVKEAAVVLHLPALDTAKLMARWVQQGWLARVRRGLYVPVPVEGFTAEGATHNPGLLAAHVFAPCYLAGWSAATHWGLTPRTAPVVMVSTTRKVGRAEMTFGGSNYQIKKITPAQFFGTKAVWRDGTWIKISDPHKTIVDMLDDPGLGGGARGVERVFRAYFETPLRDLDQLIAYAQQMKNGAIFKRLGWLLERCGVTDATALAAVRAHLTAGNAKIDARLICNRLITRWRLWIPKDDATSRA